MILGESSAVDGRNWTAELSGQTDRIREHIVAMCTGVEGGHLGGSLSLVEILTSLYFAVLNVDPRRADDPERDIFILSKGHGALALYATLAERGFFDPAELAGFGAWGSRLMAHPVRAVPGVEMPTGSLGHGLALGAGFALAARLDRRPRRSFVVLGDGELQEGSVWETAMGAAALSLDNLVAIVDRNGLQITGDTERVCPLEPLADRWRSFGWSVYERPGHDLDALVPTLADAPWEPGRPSVLIAHTVKGAGVPFAAGLVQSHFLKVSPRQQARASVAIARAALSRAELSRAEREHADG
jgi:transketolase